MSLVETSYQTLLRTVYNDGVWQHNRTGYDSRFIPAGMIQADLREGFPLLTLRKLFYKGGLAEAQGFLRGYTSAADFEALGCKFWTANANIPSKGSDTSPWLSSPFRQGHNDLGKIYGYIWRNWPTKDGAVIDQIEELMRSITQDPTSRRHMVATWDPEIVLKKMGALPPCHDSWTINIDVHNKLMHLSWRQRSTDIILGTPTNLVCYAFILMLIARLTGYAPGMLTGHLDNVHYYENHVDAVPLLLNRSSVGLPELLFSREVPIGAIGKPPESEWLQRITNDHVTLVNYKHHEAIPGLTMAV
jgi:thymidylate synthase